MTVVAALDINFTRRRRAASPLGWLLLVAGGLALGVVALDHQQAKVELQAVQERAQRQARELRPGPRRQVAPVSPETAVAVARVGTALAQPWDGLLRELEAQRDPRVALLGIEAQAATRSLRMTGEARSMNDVVAYVNRLRRSALTQSAVLSTHEARREGEVDLIRFSLDLVWKAPL